MTVVDPTARREAVLPPTPAVTWGLRSIGPQNGGCRYRGTRKRAHLSKPMCLMSRLSGRRVGAISIMWGVNNRSAAIRRFLEDRV
jgi:hypothetical protein